MNEVLSSPSSAVTDLRESDNEEFKVDFFRKLGYSSAEVKAAFRKLGPCTDTNSVLGELVRTRTSDAANSNEWSKTIQKDSLLPPTWAQGPCKTAPPLAERKPETELRPIVIDGSNVAMSHGNKEVFSCRGIQLAVNFFLDRGHNSITVFVPTWRKEQPRPDAPLTDQHFLLELERRKIVVFTPSRRVGGKRVVCYDDRFIVKLAYESDGVIVSNDTYRDLQGERPEWKKCIEERLLMFSFVNDKFMPPDDPLGRHGPSLDNFLRKNPPPEEQKRQLCPYDKKCTYGIKCKFYHPERANQSYQSLADELREKAQISTVNEEKNSRLLSRQSDSLPACSVSCHVKDSKPDLSKDQQGFPHPGQVTENKVLYWEDPRNSPNHVQCSGTGSQHQKEWPGSNLMANNYYANVSHEYLDSGLGSFDSQYSDISHPHGNASILSHPHPSGHNGPKRSSLQNAGHSCQCCSPSVTHTSHQHHHGHVGSNSLPEYNTYPNQMFTPSGPNHHSLPGNAHYTGAPQRQQNYWPDFFQGLPRTNGFPTSVHSSHSNSSFGSYQSHQYNSWEVRHQQQQTPSPAFDPKRLELRTKLHAIFNPQQVDTVMEMFPHLTNAEKLAAEILKFKSQSGFV